MKSKKTCTESSSQCAKKASAKQAKHSAHRASFSLRPNAAIMLSTFLLLFLAPTLLSQSTGIPVLKDNNLFKGATIYNPLVGLFAVGAALMISAASVVYMIGTALRKAEWTGLVREELYQAVISIMWGVMLFAAAVTVDRVSASFADRVLIGGAGANSGTGYFDHAQGYINQVICLSSSMTIKLEGLKMGAQYLAGMRSRFYASAWGFVLPTHAGMEVVERAIDLLQFFITPFTSSLFVQLLGLEIIHGTAFTIIMPAGILMRLFPPTRDAGSFLVATAFGLYFVFPFTYVIHSSAANYLYQNHFGYPLCSGAESAGGSLMLPTSLYNGVSGELYNLPKSLGSINLAFVGHRGLTDQLSYIAFQAVFLPAISIILTVSFIRSAMRFFSQKLD